MRRALNQQPGRAFSLALAMLPFLLVALVYASASAARLAENEADRLLPALSTMVDSMVRMASEPDKRSGDLLLWKDTLASLVRLAMGVAAGASIGLVIGVGTGLLPVIRANLSPFVAVLSMIPPLAVLPILFITFGLGETSKVVLIAIGVMPFIAREIEGRVRELPVEQLIKAQTLGAGTWRTTWRVVLPQVTPRLVDAVRLSLGTAWLFLIAAEAIASTEGLGYRIFLVRRYLAMDVILPYVCWITLLAYLMDLGLRQFNRRVFPWYAAVAGK